MLSKNNLVRNISYILILLIIIGSASAIDDILSGSDYPFNYQTLNIDLDITGEIELTGRYTSVNQVKVNLNQYPKQTTTLEFDFFNPNPNYQEKEDSIEFEFDANNIKERLEYKIFSRFTNRKNQKKITIDPNFPIVSIEQEYAKYLTETENIDSTSTMRAKASSLVRGSRGVFDASVAIARWVNENIEYELSDETENNVQKASWAYENKKGVCDEKTAVFISMLRSVGIPTRYISGISYTNILQEFGHHAWAEVYFPNYGWVPFDVTYGQFGWIDASHIPLSESNDSKQNSVEATAIGTGNSNLIIGPVDFETKVIEEGEYGFPDVEIELKTLSNEIGFGSYNIVEAKITNNKEFYEVIEIFASNVEGLEFIGNQKKFILIPPKKSEKVKWAIKISDELEKTSSYRFPFNAYLATNDSTTTYFNVTNRGIIYSETYIDNLINNFENTQVDTYSKFIETTCDTNKIFMKDENSTLKCTLNNNAVNELKTITACFQDECKQVEFGKDIEKEIEFTPIFNEIGLQTLIMNISNNHVNKNEYLNFNVKEIPTIQANLTAPGNVNFSDIFFINIDLEVSSISRPKKLKVYLNGSGRSQEWDFQSFDIDQVITIETKGRDLFANENNLVLSLQWEDALERTYTEQKEITINLINLNLWQKLYASINKIINN